MTLGSFISFYLLWFCILFEWSEPAHNPIERNYGCWFFIISCLIECLIVNITLNDIRYNMYDKTNQLVSSSIYTTGFSLRNLIDNHKYWTNTVRDIYSWETSIGLKSIRDTWMSFDFTTQSILMHVSICKNIGFPCLISDSVKPSH